MNLKDFEEIEEVKLYFVPNERYKVLGQLRSNSRIILVQCEVCEKDPELYGEGIFKVYKSNLYKGNSPCGCGSGFKYSESQTAVILSRLAKERGFIFEGFKEFVEKRVVDSRCLVACKSHGIWETSVGSFKRGSGCPECFKEFIGDFNRKPDEEMVESFQAKGKYPEGTTFKRSNRTNGKGWKQYWEVSCPVCETSVTAYAGSIQDGVISCGCGKALQTYAYISTIQKVGSPIALKFGVTRNPEKRAKSVREKIAFVYEVLEYWIFPNSDLCKAAEREVKARLKTCVISKEEMPDGYTETTHLKNIDFIRDIYEEFSGNRKN